MFIYWNAVSNYDFTLNADQVDLFLVLKFPLSVFDCNVRKIKWKITERNEYPNLKR